jgi:hypothetical protein
MEITYRNSLLDLIWFNYYLMFRTRRTQILFGLFLVAIGSTVFDMLKYTDYSFWGKVIAEIVILAISFMSLLSLPLITICFQQITSSHQRLLTKNDSKLSVSENGVITETAAIRSEIKWAGIVNLKRNKDFIFLFISEKAACLIPVRAFAHNSDADAFFSYTCRLRENANK